MGVGANDDASLLDLAVWYRVTAVMFGTEFRCRRCAVCFSLPRDKLAQKNYIRQALAHAREHLRAQAGERARRGRRCVKRRREAGGPQNG